MLYHSAFFTPLYLYGERKIVRLAFKKMPPKDQKQLKDWLADFIDQVLANQEKDIKYLYHKKPEWIDDVIHYTHYTMNTAWMNMAQKTIFPDTTNTINPILSYGIVKNAGGLDFFFYSNEHAFTHYKRTH